MKVSLKVAFSILDGRLSTKFEDVVEMLNYIFTDSLFTHQVSTALDKLKQENPKWYSDAVSVIDEIKHIEQTEDFEILMKAIDFGYASFEIELGKIDFKIPFI